MKLHQLPKATQPSKKRVGRGRGSGKGRYAGRGIKGQTKRSRVGRAQLAQYIRQLPLLRGKGFKGRQRRPEVVSLDVLNRFRQGSTITVEKLAEEGLVSGKNRWGVKILANGELEKALKFSPELQFSAGARQAIEAAGGEILVP